LNDLLSGHKQGDHGIFSERLVNRDLFPPFLPRTVLTESEVEAWMVKLLPKAFADLDKLDHHLSSVGYINHWLTTRPFFHSESGADLGGVNGACWGALVIFRVMAMVVELDKRPDLYPGVETPYTLQFITHYMARCAVKLSKHIRLSFAHLQPECHLRFEQDMGGMDFRDTDIKLFPDPLPSVPQPLSPNQGSLVRSPVENQPGNARVKASSPTISVSAPDSSRYVP
jgi:hypothetical protein